MQLEIDGERRDVGSARDAFASVGPHDDVVVVHRRADGAVLQAAGDATSGFVVDVRGGHTGDRTSASHALKATTVAVMFDRFAANDTGWPGAVVWADEGVATSGPRRRSPVTSTIVFVVALVGAIATWLALRWFVTVPFVCRRDGRELERVELRGASGRGGDLCVFVDGAEVRVTSVSPTLGWAELVVMLVVVFLVWAVYARVLSRLLRR